MSLAFLLLKKTEKEHLEMKKKKRNVCMLAYTFYESDFRVIRYAEALTQNGDTVDVIALREQGRSSFSVMNGVNVYRVQERIINEKKKFSYLFRILRFLFKSFWFLIKKTNKTQYDLVHVHNVPDFLVFAAFLPKILGSKVILDIHDILPEFYASKFSNGKKGWMFKIMVLVERLSIAFADHIIISNDIWKKRLEYRSVKPNKITVIINYADQDIFFPHRTRKHDNELIILYPGTVNWHQGLDIAVRAFSLVVDEIPNLNFYIYGSGTHVDYLRKLIADLKISNRVFIYKSKPLREISKIIANADIGIIPKRNDQFGGEAFSTKTLEFMSSGIPIILSRTRVDDYYFNDSIVTFFKPENVIDLSKKIKLLVSKPALRIEYARKALDFMQSNNWNAKKNMYLKLIDEL